MKLTPAVLPIFSSIFMNALRARVFSSLCMLTALNKDVRN
ncbi:PTPA-CTERM sorting domain-containing protein [Patescibacteria group bacterium]